MNNLKKLGLFFSVGTIAAFSLVGCGDDDDSTTPAGGGTGGTATAGTTSTAGTTAAGTTSTGGGGSGSGGTAAGGGGSGGTAAGGGGSGGTAAGGGGSGGTAAGGGGAGGGGGSGGSGGGAAVSADCKKWCEGDMGVVKKCMGHALMNPLVDTVEKCESKCTIPAADGANGLACWITHTNNVTDAASKDPHCGHASGLATKAGPCNEIK